jgi:2-amino-4-hydroxy-6-hydroxymethyldihydropteridine diphosphokinase
MNPSVRHPAGDGRCGELVAVGLGSNLGDRLGHLEAGMRRLGESMEIAACSSVYESQAVGDRDQGPFLNLILLGTTELDPLELLAAAARVETRSGRRRTRRWGPRTLDVDLILWGDRVLDLPDLTVPHPRWTARAFVLAPLAEVGPALTDPESGRSVAELWEERRPVLEPAVIRYPPPSLPEPVGRGADRGAVGPEGTR